MHPDGNRLGNDTAVKKVLRYFSLSVYNLIVFRYEEHLFLIYFERLCLYARAVVMIPLVFFYIYSFLPKKLDFI